MNVARSEMKASCCRAPSSWRMVYPQCSRSRCEWRRRPRRRNVSVRSRSLMHCSMPAPSAWYSYCNWYVPLPVIFLVHKWCWMVWFSHTHVWRFWECYGFSLSGSTLQLPRFWPICRSHQSRNMDVIRVKVQPYPRRPIWVSVRVSHLQIFYLLYCDRQLTVSIVVSAIAVFRLVDNLVPSCLQIVHWPSSNCLQTQTATPVSSDMWCAWEDGHNLHLYLLLQCG